eukprot:1279172-Pleurochrysis_carterae.AAC.1
MASMDSAARFECGSRTCIKLVSADAEEKGRTVLADLCAIGLGIGSHQRMQANGCTRRNAQVHVQTREQTMVSHTAGVYSGLQMDEGTCTTGHALNGCRPGSCEYGVTALHVSPTEHLRMLQRRRLSAGVPSVYDRAERDKSCGGDQEKLQEQEQLVPSVGLRIRAGARHAGRRLLRSFRAHEMRPYRMLHWHRFLLLARLIWNTPQKRIYNRRGAWSTPGTYSVYSVRRVTTIINDRYNSLATVGRLVTSGIGPSLARLGRVSESGGPRARPLATPLSLPCVCPRRSRGPARGNALGWSVGGSDATPQAPARGLHSPSPASGPSAVRLTPLLTRGKDGPKGDGGWVELLARLLA